MPTDDSTKPCPVCGSTEHTTDGHLDGGSPVTAGHIDGGAPPDYAVEPVYVEDDDDRR
jgi:hypothetical protein